MEFVGKPNAKKNGWNWILKTIRRQWPVFFLILRYFAQYYHISYQVIGSKSFLEKMIDQIWNGISINRLKDKSKQHLVADIVHCWLWYIYVYHPHHSYCSTLVRHRYRKSIQQMRTQIICFQSVCCARLKPSSTSLKTPEKHTGSVGQDPICLNEIKVLVLVYIIHYIYISLSECYLHHLHHRHSFGSTSTHSMAMARPRPFSTAVAPLLTTWSKVRYTLDRTWSFRCSSRFLEGNI